MYVVIALLFGIAGICPLAHADTTRVAGGNVSGVWTPAHSPYFVEGNLWVPTGDSLRIEAGVLVRFSGAFALMVNGTLNVQGTAQDSVVFTALTNWRGLQFWEPSDVQQIRGALIEKVGVTEASGAIVCVSCTLEVNNTSIRNGLQVGGRAFYGIAARAEFDSCDLADNTQGCGCGGAMRLDESSRVKMSDCRVHGSSATDGGAFCLYQSELVLGNCDIEDNESAVWGGAIYAEGFDSPAVIEATDCIFRHNHSSTSGVYYGWATDSSTWATFTGCQFIDNSAEATYGSTGVLQPIGHLAIDRCTFDGNGPGMAGAIHSLRTASVRNSIFANTSGGAAVVNSGGILNVEYCDFYHNVAGNVLGLPPGGFGNVDTVNFNGDSCDVSGNLFLDPAFADTALGDYHLSANSPCIDAGDPDSPLDPDGSIMEMGALPFGMEMSTPHERAIIHNYALNQNFPNPFNSRTRIVFNLPRAQRAQVRVFDVAGRTVAVLADGWFNAGEHQLEFGDDNLPSGVYVYRLQTNGFSQSRKLVILK